MKTREVPRPAVVSSYFLSSNVIDSHNQVRQGELRYEKHWGTIDPWQRLCTTIVFGQTVTDAWMLARCCVSSSHRCRKISSTDFAAKVAKDLHFYPFSNEVEQGVDIPFNIDLNVSDNTLLSPLTNATMNSDTTFSFTGVANSLQTVESEVQKFPSPSTYKVVSVPLNAPLIPQEFLCLHPMASFPKKHGSRAKRLACSDPECSGRTQFYCIQCKKSFCDDFASKTNERCCFYNHICNAYSRNTTTFKDFNLRMIFNSELLEWKLKRQKSMGKANEKSII